MRNLPTYEVTVGESLLPLKLFVRPDGALLTGLASGYTFELKVGPVDGGAVLFTKTDGITGQAGAGFAPSGTPNVVVQWEATGELDALSEGTYLAQLALISGGKRAFFPFLIRARAAL